MTSIALIGNTADAHFATFVRWIRTDYPSVTANTFANVSEWETACVAVNKHQLTLVLQSHSDQYSPQDVSRLVGGTLFSGLLCCFGPWCEGDGRSHQIWPCSTRVPVRYAKQVVCSEIDRIKAGLPVLPPTAARDEVFSHRQAKQIPEHDDRFGKALVVSPDRVYRSTLAQVMALHGWDVKDAGMGLTRQETHHEPHLLVHDLDPLGTAVSESINSCITKFPDAQIFGVANMPQALDSDSGIQVPVVPKLDPFLAIEQIVDWLRSASVVWPAVVTLI